MEGSLPLRHDIVHRKSKNPRHSMFLGCAIESVYDDHTVRIKNSPIAEQYVLVSFRRVATELLNAVEEPRDRPVEALRPSDAPYASLTIAAANTIAAQISTTAYGEGQAL